MLPSRFGILAEEISNTVFPEMNFSNKRPHLTPAFMSNISLEIVRAIAGTGSTNNIAAELLPQRGAAILF